MKTRTSAAAALVLMAAVSMPTAMRAQGGFNGAGRYEIANIQSGKVIDLDRNDRTTVIQFSARNTDNQFWDIRAAGPGFWFFRNAMRGATLEAMGLNNSTPVRGMPFTGGPSQQWRIMPGRDGNALITNRIGKTLDIPNGSGRDGAPVQTYEVNGEANQRFIFRRVGSISMYSEGRTRDMDMRRDAHSGGYEGPGRIWRIDGDGVCFYRETGYRGRGFCLRAGEDVRGIPDEWAGSFQSVKFFGRVRTVVLFEHADFGGRRVRLQREQPDLKGARVESFRVY
jgi:hypothetical protein